MRSQKVVFILGTGHSGSTLLGLILGSHSQVFGLGEVKHLRRVIDEQDQQSPRLCGICDQECPFWNQRVSLSLLQRYYSRKRGFSAMIRHASRYRRSIYRYFFEWADCDVLVDSSKGSRWIEQQLRPRYHWRSMDLIVVLLTRDGRAVVNSLLRKYPDKGIEQVTLSWKKRAEAAVQFYNHYPCDHRFRLSYEHLASEPSKAIGSLCEFLELAYEPAMLEYWKHEHHPISGNLGTRSLIFRYQSNLAEQASERWEEGQAELRARHGDYYDETELAIQLDLRWKVELSRRQQQVFDSLAGETNEPFAYSG